MTAGSLFDVVIEPGDPFRIATLHGVLDVATSGSLRATLLDLAQEPNSDLILDLRALEFLDSTGLGALIAIHKRAVEANNQLRLVVTEGKIERLLRISGLTEAFAVYFSIDDAREDRHRIVSLID